MRLLLMEAVCLWRGVWSGVPTMARNFQDSQEIIMANGTAVQKLICPHCSRDDIVTKGPFTRHVNNCPQNPNKGQTGVLASKGISSTNGDLGLESGSGVLEEKDRGPVGKPLEEGELGANSVIPEAVAPAKKGRFAKAPTSAKNVVIPAIQTQIVEIPVKGKSLLVVHAWSTKAQNLMLRKQMGEANQARENKNPRQDFLDCFYVMPGYEAEWAELREEFLARDGDEAQKDNYIFGDGKDGRPLAPQRMFGFPAIAFKAATVDACRTIQGFPMTLARGAFHIVKEGNDWDKGDMVGLTWDRIAMRRDMVRLAMGVADIRFRPAFYGWKAVLRFELDTGCATVSQLTNLVNRGGFAVGIGEHRPSRNGSWGIFEVDAEVK